MVRCNRNSVFKDGGRQTGSTYISALRQDNIDLAVGISSGSIRSSAAELLDPENGGLAVGTALISSLEAEISVKPV